jgi:hypothetical protein
LRDLIGTSKVRLDGRMAPFWPPPSIEEELVKAAEEDFNFLSEPRKNGKNGRRFFGVPFCGFFTGEAVAERDEEGCFPFWPNKRRIRLAGERGE